MLRRFTRILVIGLLVCLPWLVSQVQTSSAQSAADPSPTLTSPPPGGSKGVPRKTLLDFVNEGGKIGWFTIGIGVVGVFFVLEQFRTLQFERYRTRGLAGVPIRFDNVAPVLDAAQTPRACRSWLARALLSVAHVFESTGRVDKTEVLVYTKSLEDRFGRFRTRIDFLSDTAGALGLLGTIWGMYATFIVEKLDRTAVTRGMALALVTTYIGIIVSVVLNFLATEVATMFSRRLDVIHARTDELRSALIARRSG